MDTVLDAAALRPETSTLAADVLAQIAAPRQAKDATRFDFHHPVFQIKGSRFGLASDDSAPVYFVSLGEMQAAIPIVRLPAAFDIAPDSEDARLLATVEKGLRYVHEIRPGDSIPSELLDGTASWTVSPQHMIAAQARFAMQLVSWLNGKQLDTLDGNAFADLLEHPETKSRVQEAFAAIAVKLGLGVERKQEIVDKIDQLAREFSYVEALRSRGLKVKKISLSLRLLAGSYKRERAIFEEVGRAQSLIAAPVARLAALLDQVDANTGEILSLLRKFEETIAYIRRMRDELHQQLMRWDDLVKAWEDTTIERSAENERRIRQTYRFVARYFPQTSDWSLSVR